MTAARAEVVSLDAAAMLSHRWPAIVMFTRSSSMERAVMTARVASALTSGATIPRKNGPTLLRSIIECLKMYATVEVIRCHTQTTTPTTGNGAQCANTEAMKITSEARSVRIATSTRRAAECVESGATSASATTMATQCVKSATASTKK
jgi:hypothetical protein